MPKAFMALTLSRFFNLSLVCDIVFSHVPPKKKTKIVREIIHASNDRNYSRELRVERLFTILAKKNKHIAFKFFCFRQVFPLRVNGVTLYVTLKFM